MAGDGVDWLLTELADSSSIHQISVSPQMEQRKKHCARHYSDTNQPTRAHSTAHFLCGKRFPSWLTAESPSRRYSELKWMYVVSLSLHSETCFITLYSHAFSCVIYPRTGQQMMLFLRLNANSMRPQNDNIYGTGDVTDDTNDEKDMRNDIGSVKNGIVVTPHCYVAFEHVSTQNEMMSTFSFHSFALRVHTLCTCDAHKLPCINQS